MNKMRKSELAELMISDLSIPQSAIAALQALKISSLLDVITNEQEVCDELSMTDLENLKHELSRFGLVAAFGDYNRLIKR